jgi:hypothetical protein
VEETVKVIIKRQPPAWLESTNESLRELLALPPNWDSYGAAPIQVESVMASIDLLRAIMRDDTPAPAVVPTSRGLVQLEWHRDGVDLEIEVRSLGKYSAYFENSHTGEAWEEEIDWDLSRLIDCISKLSNSNQAI